MYNYYYHKTNDFVYVGIDDVYEWNMILEFFEKR